MFIESIELIGCKRFILKNINRLHVTYSEILQIILGTNGSGKSSLLAESSPLPAIASDYIKNGSKTIKISHNNNYYICISDFSVGGSGRHSFFKNGTASEDNLNTGGTATVQRELVLQEFNYTDELHEVLIGRNRFTAMSPAQRNHWITVLSTMDLRFANKIFTQFKGLSRDATGALKHIQSRLTNEQYKLAEYADLEGLDDIVKQTQTEITMLMENRELGLPGRWEITQRMQDTLYKLSQVSKQVLAIKFNKPTLAIIQTTNNYKEVEDALNTLQQQRHIFESILNTHKNEYVELDVIVSTLNNTGSESAEDLIERLHILKEEVKHQSTLIAMDHLIGNVEDILNDTVSVSDDLAVAFANLPSNIDKRYSRSQYDTDRELLQQLQNRQILLSNNAIRITHKVDHIQQAKDTQCPKCTYKWTPGVSEGELEQLLTTLVNIENEQNELVVQVSALKIKLDDTEQYIAQLRVINQLNSSYPRLKTLWDRLTTDSIIQNCPSNALPIIQTWLNDIKHSLSIQQTNVMIKSLEETVEHIKLVNNSGSSHISDRIVMLERQISETTERLEQTIIDHEIVRQYRDLLQKVSESKAEIVRLTKAVLDDQELLQCSIRDAIIQETIASQQTTLAINQTKLNEKQTLGRIITDLEASLNTVTLEKEAMQLIVDALNPKDGLIAEHLMTSILSVVDNINLIISAIWTHPLMVQNCQNKNGELDFKFPFINSHQDEPVPDIAVGSTAQVDIFNFAFVYVVYTRLGLKDYPLFLDEIGRTFDEVHRTNITQFIKSCIETRQFNQVFMISHYAGQYGSLANSETLVIDGSNISVPVIHNKHVTME